MPSARRRSGGDRGVGHDGRVLGQRLDAAQGLGAGEELQAPQERARLAERAAPFGKREAEHPAEAGHLPLRQRVLRVRAEAGVDHLRDLAGGIPASGRRAARSPGGAPYGRPASSFRAGPGSCRRRAGCRPWSSGRRRSGRAARGRGRPRRRRRRRSGRSGTWSSSGRPGRRPAPAGAGSTGVMKVLSTARRTPRGGADPRDGADVGQPQQRVGRRLQPAELGARADRGGDRAGVARVDEGEAEAEAAEDLVEQAKAAAVDVVAGDHVIARVAAWPARRSSRRRRR